MSNLSRDIGSEDLKIGDLATLLSEDKFLIPTFQREFVWNPDNIKKLWDSMFRFFPIGSILYWETDSYLHTHRRIGGFQFPHDEDTVRKFKDWKYILDGQQRATSILVSLRGGKGRVQENEEFDYSLHFDSTNAEFFFADELEKRRTKVPDERLLVRLKDVPRWGFTFYKEISQVEGFNETVEQNLQQIQRMFTDYKLSIIRIKGVEVSEVCEIFERINQEGKKLDPVDIMVARTYRQAKPDDGYAGFYLRDNLADLKNTLTESNGRWQDIDDLLVIQMFAICLRKQHKTGRQRFGITPKALDNLQTVHFEESWAECTKSILETVKFLMDQKIQGPGMLPFVFLAIPLCYYFHRNKEPNRDIARQWFWRHAFGLDTLGNSTDVYNFCEEFFAKLETGDGAEIPRLPLSKKRLIQSSYYYRSGLSRAVLAFLANQTPVDFSDPHAEVLDNVYLLLSQTPNLHHIYPQNFLNNTEGLPEDASPDSLMNICYLRAKTNIQISDENPLEYFKQFEKIRDFDAILDSHLMPKEFLQKPSFAPSDYAEFLKARVVLFAEKLRESLPDVEVHVTE